MKSIKIIYERYSQQLDLILDYAIIPFSKKTTIYVESMTYEENMEAMIFDILENGFVFVNEDTAVPVFSIRQYISNKNIENRQPVKEEDKKKIQHNDIKSTNHKRKKWKPVRETKPSFKEIKIEAETKEVSNQEK